MDSKRLQELRAEHRPGWIGCITCLRWVNDETVCEQSKILDLALEAERLRAALARHHGQFAAGCDCALAGMEAKGD